MQGTHGLQNYSFIGDLQDFSFDAEYLLSDQIVQNQVWDTFKIHRPSAKYISDGNGRRRPELA